MLSSNKLPAHINALLRAYSRNISKFGGCGNLTIERTVRQGVGKNSATPVRGKPFAVVKLCGSLQPLPSDAMRDAKYKAFENTCDKRLLDT